MSAECPIWHLQLSQSKITAAPDGAFTKVDSVRAGGLYVVERNAFDSVKNLNIQQRVVLTSWLVQKRQSGNSCPKITTSVVNDLKNDKLMEKRDMLVAVRALNLLRYLEAQSSSFDKVIKSDTIEVINELFAWTASYHFSEVVWLIERCKEQGWITHKALSDKDSDHEMTLTFTGHLYIAEYS